ncbi:hypothetical protein [Blastococcus xanthinilyticus]|uniref:Uncharacterized protein n=1 Tax=Blastococcus xanthinilyticus TaxID=1564164 RepID=A0A5S5CYC7_9ACTN|nr:hypothetical protein [Blastococcus xanthinilyticus]TYP88545.1 hypothetical protein BD833_104253 [Blastococcus xanthinilyticus]
MASYWVPVITASGTVLASIITGFIAAKVKHGWDQEDAQETWDRERAERRRDEVRDALMAYMTARDAMELEVMQAFTQAAAGSPMTRSDPVPAIMALKGYASRVQLLVNQATSATIGADFDRFTTWYKEPPVTPGSGGNGASISTTQGIRDFARTVLKDLPLA